MTPQEVLGHIDPLRVAKRAECDADEANFPGDGGFLRLCAATIRALVAERDVLRSAVACIADDACFYGDNCAAFSGTRHGQCSRCRAVAALAEAATTPTWEADHQRRALEAVGLADEFPFGCDAIDHVAEALLVARAEVERLRAELAQFRAEAQAATSLHAVPVLPVDHEADRRVDDWCAGREPGAILKEKP